MVHRRRNQIYYNGVCSLDLGIAISKKRILTAPEPILQATQVPYGSRVHYEFEGYNNVEIEYETIMLVDHPWDFPGWMTEVKRCFLQHPGTYKPLYDTYDDMHYRMATYSGGLEPENEWHKVSQQTITFNCAPWRYLKSGDEEISSESSSTSVTVYNPTAYDAYPIIKVVQGASLENEVDLTIDYEDESQYTGVISGVYNTVYGILIDCDRRIIRNGTENTDPLLASAELAFFPVLKPGENKITIRANGAAGVQIQPKWREL